MVDNSKAKERRVLDSIQRAYARGDIDEGQAMHERSRTIEAFERSRQNGPVSKGYLDGRRAREDLRYRRAGTYDYSTIIVSANERHRKGHHRGPCNAACRRGEITHVHPAGRRFSTMYVPVYQE